MKFSKSCFDKIPYEISLIWKLFKQDNLFEGFDFSQKITFLQKNSFIQTHSKNFQRDFIEKKKVWRKNVNIQFEKYECYDLYRQNN